jgi:hypothetical protein
MTVGCRRLPTPGDIIRAWPSGPRNDQRLKRRDFVAEAKTHFKNGEGCGECVKIPGLRERSFLEVDLLSPAMAYLATAPQDHGLH